MKGTIGQYKFSVVRDWNGSVLISMMKETRLQSLNTLTVIREYKKGTLGQNDGYDQINTYYTGDFYGKENAEIFDKIVKIGATEGYQEVVQ